ncbi:hypothetical protein CR513_40184, partial [Mucuna pruriens]
MKLPPGQLIECLGTLYGIVGKQVPIKGAIELETVFGEGSRISGGRRSILQYHHGAADVKLNGSFCFHLSPLHEVPDRTKDLDLDPRGQYEHERPHPTEDLKEIQVGPSPVHKMRISTTMDPKEEVCLVAFLKLNSDVFVWTMDDIPGIDLEFMCHHLSIARDAKSVAQKKCKRGEEKRKAVREEMNKLLVAGFIREVQYPTWLANVVMVKKVSGKWRMCTNYTDLNQACRKDPYPLPSIDRLVEGSQALPS